MTPTLAQLIACGLTPTIARTFLAPIATHCPAFGIDTPLRLAAFIGECRVESGGFARMEESFFYRLPETLHRVFPSRFPLVSDAMPYVMGKDPKGLAIHVYGGRLGNRPEPSSDGWDFRGSGPTQLTGRANFRHHGDLVGRDWITNPDDVRTPDGGILAACSFFKSEGLLPLADASHTDAITSIINRGMLAAAERKQAVAECLLALS